MTDHMVEIRKAVGGVTIVGPDGKQYTWAKNGSVLEVPYEWALELLAIPDGGFTSVADEPPGKVTEPEPEPEPENKVTEPDPEPEGTANPEGQGSPVKPRPRAGTRSRK